MDIAHLIYKLQVIELTKKNISKEIDDRSFSQCDQKKNEEDN
jgi:hypothetical protein